MPTPLAPGSESGVTVCNAIRGPELGYCSTEEILDTRRIVILIYFAVLLLPKGRVNGPPVL